MSFLVGAGWFRLINILVLLNPLFGMLIAFMLLYEADETECFIVLGFETVSMILHWVGLYVEGTPQTKWTLLVHCFPMLPYIILVIVIVVTVNQGGVCYVPALQLFAYDGCQLCILDGDPAPPDELSDECPTTEYSLVRGTYCSESDPSQNYCWYAY